MKRKILGENYNNAPPQGPIIFNQNESDYEKSRSAFIQSIYNLDREYLRMTNTPAVSGGSG